MAGGKGGKASIIIKKEEVVEGGHHGGAWKVAYADFVTAMMAFFLLMWLLNATTEAQKRGIADYFSPHNSISDGKSGFGMPFGGRTPNSDGALASDRGAVQVNEQKRPLDQPEDIEAEETPGVVPGATAQPGAGATGGADGAGVMAREGGAEQAPQIAGVGSPLAGSKPHQPTAAKPNQAPTDKDIQAELDKRERAAFESAAQQIRDAVSADPALSDLARQLMIDVTPEGLRVQLVDEERQPMFAIGSAAPNDRARAVLAKITPVLMRLPEAISITGHTDAAPYKGADRTNWDLSADRANATRRLLIEAGLPEARVRGVTGMADRDPLMADDRLAAANRRIAIVVLRDKPAARQ
jgi:chemotaxis protein MotB